MAASPRHEIGARRWTTIALLWIAVVVNYIDRGGLSIVAVPMMKEFAISPAAMGTLLSAFFWTYTLMQVPAGWIVDRFGIKWSYAAAFVLWSLASAGVGLAGSFGQVLALRLILGIGEAAAQPASLAYIRKAFPDDRQGLPTAVYLTGLSIGPAAGTFFGSLLLAEAGWRAMFIILGLGCCIWLIPWLALAPGQPTRSEQTASVSQPIDWKDLLSRPMLWGIFIGGFFYSYFWYFCLTWLPSYLVMDRKMDFLQMGIYASLPFVAKVPVSIAAGRFSDRLAQKTGRPVLVRKSFVASGFLLGTCILLLLAVKSQMGSVAILVASLMGVAVASANFWALTQAVTPPGIIGRVVGLQNTVGNTAGILAPIVTGWLVATTGGFDAAIWFAGLSLLIASAAYLFLVREKDAGDLCGKPSRTVQ
jgi:MFS family permease